MCPTPTDVEPTDEELLCMLRQRGLLDTAAVTAPTVEDLADRWLRTLPSTRSRQTYETRIQRFSNGVGPVCESRCEPCMVAPTSPAATAGIARIRASCTCPRVTNPSRASRSRGSTPSASCGSPGASPSGAA